MCAFSITRRADCAQTRRQSKPAASTIRQPSPGREGQRLNSTASGAKIVVGSFFGRETMELSMKCFLIRFTVAALLCIANRTETIAQVPPPDYQKMADDANWPNFEKLESFQDCFRRELPDYQVQITRLKHREFVRIRILDDNGNEVHAWNANPSPPFIERDGILYYALYASGSSGCKIVAYDLKQQKLLWESQLKAIPLKGYSRYQNEVRFGPVLHNEALVVVGRESFGRYIEIIDLKTSETVVSFR